MRARIALRKAKLPTPVGKVNEEMAKIRANNGRPVSAEDIVAAFETGAEVCNSDPNYPLPQTRKYQQVIDIIRMQCIAYDHTFANDLEAKFKVWDSPEERAQWQLLKNKRKPATRKTRSSISTTTPQTTAIVEDPWCDGAFDSDLTEYSYLSSEY